MQQPSVTDFFKVKKRTRDDVSAVKSSKLVAVSSASAVSGGRDTPNPIKAAVVPTSPQSENVEQLKEPEVLSVNCNIEIDRKTVKGKRRVPCYKRHHHLISKTNQEEDIEMTPTLTKDASIPISSLASVSINSSKEISSSSSSTQPQRDAFAPTLALPYKFNLLLELFRGVETVCSIFFNRKEIITFNKLKPAVLELVRSVQLREKHLGQFLTVFPECYRFAQEKMTKGHGSREFSYQLVITPNLGATPSVPSSERMSAAILVERRKVFEGRLLEVCLAHHKNFLLSLKPPIVIPSNKKITRWHPKFLLNEIPDIELTEIPKAPDSDSMGSSSAKEVIARAQNIIEAANPRMKKALEDLMKKTAAVYPPTSTPPPPVFQTSATTPPGPPVLAPTVAASKIEATKNSILKAKEALMARAKDNPKMREAMNKLLEKNNKAPIPSPEKIPVSNTGNQQKGNQLNKKTLEALKGVSQNLLDKIRAREQEKSIRAMTLTPEETKKRTMLSRLPEFVKIVRNTMVAESKTVLPFYLIVDRLSHSHGRALTENEVENHVRLLHETVPKWLSIVKCSQGEFVKINKDVNINDIIKNIDEIIKKTNT